MRVPKSVHESHPWRIDEIAPEFRLEDAWALPAWGRAGDFATLLEVMESLDLAHGKSRATRLLFGLRDRLGRVFGWDDAASDLPIPGDTETSLRARVPDDLAGDTTSPSPKPTRFTPLYSTDGEWAAELSNRTVHAVMQIAWIDQGGGRYQGQLGVYVKPRGTLGALYMAAIAPFRHRIVYPALMRQIEEAWRSRRDVTYH